MDRAIEDEGHAVIEILPGIFRWERHIGPIPAASYAVRTHAGLIAIDPLIPQNGLASLLEVGEPTAAILTSHDHERDAAAFEARFGLRTYVNAIPDDTVSRRATRFNVGDTLFDEFHTIELGAILPGEVGLYLERDGGTLIVGDAFYNIIPQARDPLSWLLAFFAPYGRPQPQPLWLSRSPRLAPDQLDAACALSFENLLLSHGTPIIGGAAERTRAVLAARRLCHERRKPHSE